MNGPAWVPCPDCENYWCRAHDMHAHDCPCPAVEECEEQGWNPYLEWPPG